MTFGECAPAAGHVRVTNMRSSAGLDNAPQAGETVYRVDRANPVLGNRHFLFNRFDSEERRRVIAAYGHDLERDLARSGPMSAEIARLADRVRAGEQICLACWCAPAPCHGDLIAKAVREQLEHPGHGLSERDSSSRRAERAT